MVKNANGGKRAKGMARKTINASAVVERTVFARDVGEVYAQCTRLVGGNHFMAVDLCGKPLRVFFRGKFSGKRRRSNPVLLKSWVLVGMRDYVSESSDGDLLEIYSDHDKSQLKKLAHIDWSLFVHNDNYLGTSSTAAATASDCDFVFADRDDQDLEHIGGGVVTHSAAVAMDTSSSMHICVDDI